MSLPSLNFLCHVRLCVLVLSDTTEAQRGRAATKLAVDKLGSAASHPAAKPLRSLSGKQKLKDLPHREHGGSTEETATRTLLFASCVILVD